MSLCADVPAGTVVPRRLSNVDLAIWCGSDGSYHAWGDRCPHRGMRLSHGFVRGDTLACIYHGWQYDADGACAYIPAHPKLDPPKTICAQTYACTAQDGAIWVSLENASAPLPGVGGRRPIRTMEVETGAEGLAMQLGQPLALLIEVDTSEDLALAIQPSTDATCLIHAFADSACDPKAVSRKLEDMRQSWEAAA